MKKTQSQLDDELVEAAKKGEFGQIESLLKEGADPGFGGSNALTVASMNGHVGVVKLLLTDSRSNPADDDSRALNVACSNGHLEVAKLLLADPRSDPNNGSLREASFYGHIDVVKLLLADPRVSLTEKDNLFQRASVPVKIVDSLSLRKASARGHADVVELLLSDPRINPAAEDNAALRMACDQGHVDVVKLLLANRHIDPSVPKNTAFCKACEKGQIEVVKLLLSDQRINPADQDNAAFRMACENGHVEVVKKLLSDAPINPADKDNAALCAACEKGRVEVVKLLLADYRIDPTFPKNQALSLASQSGNVEVVRHILRAGGGEYFATNQKIPFENETKTRTWEVDVDAQRKAAFTIYPILFETLADEMARKKDHKALLPEAMQEAIDTGNTKKLEAALQEHYGISAKQLQNIPCTDSLIFNGKTIVSLVKAGVITPEQLPPLSKEIPTQAKWPKNPEKSVAMCNTLQACFKLALEMGFTDIDRNNPNTYPEFLTNLIINSAAQGSQGKHDGWVIISKTLPEQLIGDTFHPSGIRDAVDDFINTVFLPHALQGKVKYDIDKEREIIAPKVLVEFFKDTPISTICKLSERWHEQGRATQLSKAKTFSGSWEPLFPGKPPVYHTPSGHNVVAVPLTNTPELNQEGKDLSHCVGTYTPKCQRDRSHIISLRDEKTGKALSTIELKVVEGKTDSKDKKVISIKGQTRSHLALQQHYGHNNDSPKPQCHQAAELLFTDIREGKVKVDLDKLEQKRKERETILQDQKELALVGYDPHNQAHVANATHLYRREGIGGSDTSQKLASNFDSLVDTQLLMQVTMDEMYGKGKVVVTINKTPNALNPESVVILPTMDSTVTAEDIAKTLKVAFAGQEKSKERPIKIVPVKDSKITLEKSSKTLKVEEGKAHKTETKVNSTEIPPLEDDNLTVKESSKALKAEEVKTRTTETKLRVEGSNISKKESSKDLKGASSSQEKTGEVKSLTDNADKRNVKHGKTRKTRTRANPTSLELTHPEDDNFAMEKSSRTHRTTQQSGREKSGVNIITVKIPHEEKGLVELAKLGITIEDNVVKICGMDSRVETGLEASKDIVPSVNATKANELLYKHHSHIREEVSSIIIAPQNITVATMEPLQPSTSKQFVPDSGMEKALSEVKSLPLWTGEQLAPPPKAEPPVSLEDIKTTVEHSIGKTKEKYENLPKTEVVSPDERNSDTNIIAHGTDGVSEVIYAFLVEKPELWDNQKLLEQILIDLYKDIPVGVHSAGVAHHPLYKPGPDAAIQKVEGGKFQECIKHRIDQALGTTQTTQKVRD